MSNIEIVNLKRDIEKLSKEKDEFEIANLKGEINESLYNLKYFPNFDTFIETFYKKLSNIIKIYTKTNSDFKFDGLKLDNIYKKFKENRLLNYKLENFTNMQNDELEDVGNTTIFDTVKSNSSNISFSFSLLTKYNKNTNTFSFFSFSDDFKKQIGGSLYDKQFYKFNIIVTKLSKFLPASTASPRAPLTNKIPKLPLSAPSSPSESDSANAP